MTTKAIFYFILFITITFQKCFAQVDVVYSNLVWSDECSTSGPVDASKWFQQTQLPAGGSWFNGEVQHYTDQLTNSFVNNGFLNVVAKKEPYTSQGVTKQYTSARLNSKFAFLYGRVDVRAKVPVSQGTWPAIWLLGKNVNEDGAYFDAAYGTANWPACGEIDIMEYGITPSQPANYIQSALHTPSSFGNTTNIGGAIANNLGADYHIYSMNWSPFQISFLLDGVIFYTYSPIVKTPSNWPFNAQQYLLLNIALGGIAGTIPTNFNQAIMEVDYVRVYQNTLIDTVPPTNFTASVGAVTSSTIELLLNGTDNSGNVVYNIAYGTSSLSVAGWSGVQKSVIIPNLNPNTNYIFSITATDIATNPAANNALLLNASTTGPLGCSGTDTVATQGSFSLGYNYTFETLGNDVKITFQLLDTNRVGVVAYLWNQSPFSEVPMANVSGTTFTKTITAQTIGATINYAVKFAYANGLSVTRYIPYVVGNNCTLASEVSAEAVNFTFANPVDEFAIINSDSDIDKVQIFNMVGALVFETSIDTKKIDVSSLPRGVYFLAVFIDNKKNVKKMIIN